MREARRVAMGILSGVGAGESVEALRPARMHIRRSLSPEEMATLSAEWLAIPAQDEFSPGGVVEGKL